MASDLTKEEIDDLRASFEMFDNDKSGKSNRACAGLIESWKKNSPIAVSRTLVRNYCKSLDALEWERRTNTLSLVH